jgi:predicted acetylornithine/succinylornithine family transaminase
MNTQETIDLFDKYVIANYGRLARVIVRGEGCYLYDADGNKILDMFPGWAVSAIGHCHPKVVKALRKQAGELLHIDNTFYSEPQGELAKLLSERAFGGKCFFCNSGAEANEAALKLARRWQRDRGEDRFEIIAFEGGFHGRTLFTVSATGTPAYWEGFEPLVPGIHHAPYGDLSAVESLLGEHTAAIIVEAVQGEGGVRPAPDGFLRGLRELADESGCVLIFDEVQTGIGRTGPLFAYQATGVEPDVMTLAKALGNGIPIGAMCTKAPFAGALVPGTHASTFGGNPLAAACATAVLDELLGGGVLEYAQKVGVYFEERLERLAEKVGAERVVEVRGAGHLRAIELTEPAAPYITRCREEGVLVIQAGEKIIRLAPPLVITEEELDEGIGVLERVLLAGGVSASAGATG